MIDSGNTQGEVVAYSVSMNEWVKREVERRLGQEDP